MRALVPSEAIVRRILVVRGEKVLLDSDLAELYGVPTGRLNEQVRRNADRFPRDFMFQLSAAEVRDLRSQDAISRSGWGGRRHRPMVFTEHGVAMLSSVLRSPRAIQANIAIVRAFVRLREYLATHRALARRLAALDRKCDARFQVVFEAIQRLSEPAEDETAEPRERIGFRPR